MLVVASGMSTSGLPLGRMTVMRLVSWRASVKGVTSA